MSPAEWSRIRDVFEEAWELRPEDRPAFLERTCAGDAELRGQVEELLAAEANASAGALPDEPPTSARVALGLGASALEPGTRVGDFVLVREVARGGMGTVYEAEQDNPRRRVALKVMSLALPPGARERFRWEAEVLGRLRHPGIAQVHDAGVHVVGGHELPWFAMELVAEASPLDRFAADRALSTEARLELVLAICEAVHHGHQRGVIHRDLKPDNLLVDAAGAVKVIDFGVARATDADVERTRATRAGEIVGTLRYMSPEQVAGDRDALDVRSDVYALGVVLYELITGGSPYDLAEKSLPEAARIVRDERPRPPSAITPRLSADLETIIQTAIEKDPERRYASALALASDLRRFLAHEPIEARPPSLPYQLKLFARRNRVAVAAGALAAVALVTAAVVSAFFAVDARRSADDAHAVKTNLVDFTLQLVNELDARIQTMEGSTEVRAALVRATVERLDWLADREEGDPEVGAALCQAYLQLGGLLGNSRSFNLGDPDGARACYEKARVIAAELFRADPSVPNALLQGAAEAFLGDAARDRGEYADAEELYRGALNLLVSLDQPDAPEVLRERARLRSGIGTMRGASDDDAGAEAEFARALELRRSLAAARPGIEADEALAEAYGKRAIALVQLGRLADALEHVTEEARILSDLEAREPDNVVHRVARAEAGITKVDLLTKLGRYGEGRREAAASAAVFDSMLAADPSNSYPRMRLPILCLFAALNETAAVEAGAETAVPEALQAARGWLDRGLAALEALHADGTAPAWIEPLEGQLLRERERVAELAE